ncbi:MAG: septum formation initiator family protein [Deltaproteobacteria bacterium]|nr:septum formation initiator family protein [Deltaproteobacteria bacterium]
MSVKDSLVMTVVVFGLFLLLLFIALEDRGLVTYLEQSRKLSRIQVQNQALEEENAELFRSIERLQNDMGYVGGIARRELGMVSKDEVILRFRKDPSTDRPQSPPPAVEPLR